MKLLYKVLNSMKIDIIIAFVITGTCTCNSQRARAIGIYK